ncbi:MAG: Uma2 family endonuclease [Candidatus Melainabacteria bacterium HGW-Melainabacteria-1]|nr:MAG: Uma2 family endonuclease [Candidatus Melainabacteria bacterium HGW-Melainabacteria-1]
MTLPYQKPGTWTYQDYLGWPDSERWELLEGVAYALDQGSGFRPDAPLAMSPAPARRHQEIAAALTARLWLYFQGRSCRVYPAPFDVRLSQDTVVQPDLSVICDADKLDARGCQGAPDWIIEIVSPASVQLDYIRKFSLYEQFGVREYWIVHPIDETVMTLVLGPEGLYGRPRIAAAPERLSPACFPDCYLDLSEMFCQE